MGKYEQLARNIVKYVGGKENIAVLNHCVTRLRFQLKDETKADDDAIKELDGVVTLVKSGGQYQVVIGNHVVDVFKDVCEAAGITSSENGGEDEAQDKMSFGAKLIDIVSGTFTPLLGVMCASGMIKGLVTLLSFYQILPSDSGLYQILYATGDAIFLLFPVVLGYTSSVKFHMSPFLGTVIGCMLAYPTLQGVDLNVFGQTINVTYTSTVLPILITNFFASYLERACKRIVPDVVKTFLVPMIVLLIAAPLGFTIIGPLANMLAQLIGDAIMWVYGLSPMIAGFIVGAFWQVLVIFGLHMGLVAVAIMQLVTGQGTPIFSLGLGASFAQTAVVFAIWLKTRDKKLKGIALPAWISGIFGVTEPAIYGVTLTRIPMFVISCIGAGLAGIWYGFTGLLQWTNAGLGVFAIPGFLKEGMDVTQTIIYVLIGIAIAMIVSFVLALLLYKDDKGQDKLVITSPVKGLAKPLSEMHDEVFSSEAIGKGICVDPQEHTFRAPVSGTLTTLFPTMHAYGITTASGDEVLVHIGVDTVNLQGKGFRAFVKQGTHVKTGDPIIEADIEQIKKAGYNVETAVVITKAAGKIGEMKNGAVDNGTALFCIDA